MGNQRRRRSAGMAKKTESDSEVDAAAAASIIFLSSSDDEEANEDLTLAIIERSRQREAKRKRVDQDGGGGGGSDPQAEVVQLSSSSSDDFQSGTATAPDLDATATAASRGGVDAVAIDKKKRKKPKKQNKDGENAVTQVDALVREDEPLGAADSVITEVNEASDNAIMRKLLRGPRYFDPGEKTLGSCYNCGEEGHNAVNCTEAKREKPCFICGMFGHNFRRCTQGQDCFICKRRGHFARDCPDKHGSSSHKHNHTSQDSMMCLRCGDLGHDMLMCQNDYAPDDLKEIQCYICKEYGHLCCVDFVDTGPREVSCYNCAQSGHTGLGCAKAKIHGESSADASPNICYKCGEEGHFARGCSKKTKSRRWIGETSASQGSARENGDHKGSKSAPHYIGKRNKKKVSQFQEKWNMTGGKSRVRGGWIVDDPGDLPKRKLKPNGWALSPSTPVRNSHERYPFNAGSGYSNSQSPVKKHRGFGGSPSSYASTGRHHHGFSASRFNYPQHHFRRT